jgi:probable rRNA maturation factor
MQTLDIVTEDARWAVLNIEALAISAVTASLTRFALTPDICEVSLLACDDTQIMALNTDFRQKPTATNVLSWPAEERAAARPGDDPVPVKVGPDGMIELGDIAISYDTCLAEAVAANLPMDAHVIHLIVHGTLHLLGYDHITDQDAHLMEKLEAEILGKLGLDDPYRET